MPGALTSRTLAASRSGTPQLGLFDFLKKPSVAELIGEVANPAEFTPDELTALQEALFQSALFVGMGLGCLVGAELDSKRKMAVARLALHRPAAAHAARRPESRRCGPAASSP